jgi:mannitol operon repressor
MPSNTPSNPAQPERPLGQLEVRLKLIFALGLISLERYQDLEAYLKIRDFLVRDPKDYRFSDKPVRDLLERLNAIQQGSMMPQDPRPTRRTGPSTRCSSTGSIRWCAPPWCWR